MLIGVKDEKYSHILTNCLTVQEIEDTIQNVDLRGLMADAYRSYVIENKLKGTEPISFEHWPQGKFTITVNFKFKVVYFYKRIEKINKRNKLLKVGSVQPDLDETMSFFSQLDW